MSDAPPPSSTMIAHEGGEKMDNSDRDSTDEQAQNNPYGASFFHASIAHHRKTYLKFYFLYTFMLIILMLCMLPLYWASLAYIVDHTRNLSVWVIDRDGSTVGSQVLSAVQATLAAPFPTLGWEVVTGNTDSQQVLMDDVVDEKVWAVLLVNTNATVNALSAFSNPSTPPNPALPSISVYYNEARNELATGQFIVPFIDSLLSPLLVQISSNLTSTFLSSHLNSASDLQNLAQVLSRPQPFVTLEMNNLRPFSSPVVQAVTLVGMILIIIFSFILTIANNALRPIVAPHLTLQHYIAMRVICPLIAYLPLTLTFTLVSLMFSAPFGANFTKAGGFFLFWCISYLLMASVGLATEFVIGMVGIKFTPFFLLILILTNVSPAENPLELLPGVYKYGRGFPLYNAEQAFRTICFATKSHLSTNIPVLAAWAILSIITVSVSTWILEGRARRAKQRI